MQQRRPEALEPGELVIAVEFPRHPQHAAFRELCRRHNDFAVVSAVATGDRGHDGRWQHVRVALGGVADSPVLAAAASEPSTSRRMGRSKLSRRAWTLSSRVSRQNWAMLPITTKG